MESENEDNDTPDNVTELRPPHADLTAQSEDQGEVLTILDRDGAIQSLRHIRADIRGLGDTTAGFTLRQTAQQIDMLFDLLNDTAAQLYAVSIIASGLLGDPDLHSEVDQDMQEED